MSLTQQAILSSSYAHANVSAKITVSKRKLCAAHRIANVHPSSLVTLLRDPAATADALVAMRKALPKANINTVVSANPAVLQLAMKGSLTKVRR